MKGIVTLCGSTRFKNEFNDANFWLTLSDYIVLSVGSFLHSDNDPEIKDFIIEHKEQLDHLHKKKIDMSDAIMVIDVNGYIGDSTRSEIAHALEKGKTIYSYTMTKRPFNNFAEPTICNPDEVRAWLAKKAQQQ